MYEIFPDAPRLKIYHSLASESGFESIILYNFLKFIMCWFTMYYCYYPIINFSFSKKKKKNGNTQIWFYFRSNYVNVTGIDRALGCRVMVFYISIMRTKHSAYYRLLPKRHKSRYSTIREYTRRRNYRNINIYRFKFTRKFGFDQSVKKIVLL